MARIIKDKTSEELKEYKNKKNQRKAQNAKARGHISHRAWMKKNKED